MKYVKFTFISIILVSLTWLGACTVLYRIPDGPTHHAFEENIHYKFIEIDADSRTLFESLLGNEYIRLDGDLKLYVSASDRAKLWAVSPWDFRGKNYTYRAKLEARPLLFGGFGVAKVIDITRVTGKPHISK